MHRGFNSARLKDGFESGTDIAAEYPMNRRRSLFGGSTNVTNKHYSEPFGFPVLGRAAYGDVKSLATP